MMRALLTGQDRSPRRDVVLLNSAAALATESGDFPAALAEATRSLESGAALAKLDALASFSQSIAQQTVKAGTD
jgi:anthranilate phosphoribosyltransferase